MLRTMFVYASASNSRAPIMLGCQPVVHSVVIVILTVWLDAVHAEVEVYGNRKSVGWFADEVCAVAAVAEFDLFSGAILPEMRHIRSWKLSCEYRKSKCGKVPVKFRQTARARMGGGGRRIVKRPCSSYRPWINPG